MARPRKNAAKAQSSLLTPDGVQKDVIPVEEQPYPLPEGWKWVRLGSVIDVSKEKTEDFSSPVLRYIGLEHLEKDKGIIGYTSAEGLRSLKNIFYPGQILYGKLRPYLNKHDIVDFSGVCSTDIVVFNCKNEANNKFINFFFNVDYVTEYAVANSKGINLPRVSAQSILNIALPLPQLDEQQRIVDRIESLFAKLDEAKEKAEAVLDGFESRKAAILHKAFTGELTAKWREKKGLPLDFWEKTSLGKILKVASGKGLTSKNMDASGKISVYGGNGITGYHNQSNVVKDTIVIGRVGYYCGSVHYIKEKAWVTDNALIVFFDKNKFESLFIFYLLLHANLRQNNSSTAQPVVSGSKIYPIEVTITTIPEQQEIVRLLESLFAREQQVKEAAESVLEHIDLMKKAILAKAFRGELTRQVHNSKQR